jgi:competence protein ComEC
VSASGVKVSSRPLDWAPLLAGAVVLGSASVTAAVPVLALSVGLGVVLWRRFTRFTLAVVLVVLAGAALRGRQVLREYEDGRLAAREALGASARCSGEGTVAQSPSWQGGVARAVLESVELDCEGRGVPAARITLRGGPPDLARGDRVSFVAQLAPPRLFQNLDVPDPVPRAARVGSVLSGGALSVEVRWRGSSLWASMDRARAHVRERIQATFAPEAAPLARALVIGESDLAPEDALAFQASGLSHMLAVSGTHLVFAVLGVLRGLRALMVRLEGLAVRFDVERGVAAFGVAAALLYADFAGGSGSAWRAAFMLAWSLGVRALGRHAAAVRSLAASVVIASVTDPLLAYDASLLLSTAATGGLLVLGPRLQSLAARLPTRPLRWVAESLCATLASMLPCAPVLAAWSDRLTLAGLFANVIAAPFGETLALPLCLVHAALSAVPPLERGVALAGSGALLVVAHIAKLAASLRAFAVPVSPPGAWHLVLMAVGTVAVLGRAAPRVLTLIATAAGLCLVEVASVRAGRPEGVLRVSVLDVEQGDAVLVDLPNGELALVDGGGFAEGAADPGTLVILPVLRGRRRDAVDLMVLTHPHPDHLLGLLSVARALPVREFWDGGWRVGTSGAEYQELLALLRAQGTRVLRAPELCRAAFERGGARIRVLNPCPHAAPEGSANDASLVLALHYGRRAALLPGDAELSAEAKLVERHGAALKADFLKAGHHGSRTSSTPAFLQSVAPSVVAISCGARNRHGHPHPEVLERLVAPPAHPAPPNAPARDGPAGVVLRTDRGGGVAWWTDGERVVVHTAKPPEVAPLRGPLLDGTLPTL